MKETSVAKISTNTRVQIILVLILFSPITKAFNFNFNFNWWYIHELCLTCPNYKLSFENHLTGSDREKEMVVRCTGNNILLKSPVEVKPNPVASFEFKIKWTKWTSNLDPTYICAVTISGSNYKRQFIAFRTGFDCEEMHCTWQIHRDHPYRSRGKRFVQRDYF